MDHIQRQMNAVHILILPFFEVHFNIVIHQAASSFHISGLKCCIACLSHVHYTHNPSHVLDMITVIIFL
jgi:hypothetical protein